MVVVRCVDKLKSISCSGKIGNPGDPDPENILGIYQIKGRWPNKPLSKEVFYVPINPRTIPQQANRNKFSAGVLAWQALTSAQKMVYHKRSIGKHMSGYNLFLREYMLN